MGKGIILRVQDGIMLTSELLASLNKLLPNYKLEFFTEKPNYQQSIKRRMDSLHDAFLFSLDAYPPDSTFTHTSAEALKKYVAECKTACDLNKDTIDLLHVELVKFTANLVDALSLYYDWPEDRATKEAIATLNEAEQYMLMNKGRSDLATLSCIAFGTEKQYVLQRDESLPPYYDKLLEEMQEIKSTNYPKTNALFRHDNVFEAYQKVFFLTLDSKDRSYQNIVKEFKSFIKQWDKTKPKLDELERIRYNTLPLPLWFQELCPHLQAVVRSLSAESVSTIEEKLRRFEKRLNEKVKKLDNDFCLPDFSKIPDWYWSLSDKQQYFLEYVLKTTPKIEDALSFIPSRHRTLPLPANFAKHSLYLLDNQYVFQMLGIERFRSSHITSRDVLKDSPKDQLRHSTSNFDKVTEEAKPKQPILFQTLISPVSQLKQAAKFIEVPPDYILYEKGREAIQCSARSADTIQTNHPYNFAKYLLYTTSDNPGCLNLIATAEKYATKNPGLRELLTDYSNVLNSYLGSATFFDYQGRELFLSSLEQLIVLHMGGFSYGSCVSGKDRKALELIHTDAMLIYNAKYGKWPQFGEPSDKKERIAFVNIVVNLYVSRHQHEHAGQNAPGSEGIKTPSNYFPHDIIVAINNRLGVSTAVKHDDRLATDNEVKNIDKNLSRFLSTKQELLCQVIASQLGHDGCKQLYSSLYNLINEKWLFEQVKILSVFNSWTYTSAGILQITALLTDSNAGDPVARIAKIFSIVLDRPGPEKDDMQGRPKATRSVYNCIRGLLHSGKSDHLLNENLENTIKEWDTLFNASKALKEPDESKMQPGSYVLNS